MIILLAIHCYFDIVHQIWKSKDKINAPAKQKENKHLFEINMLE